MSARKSKVPPKRTKQPTEREQPEALKVAMAEATKHLRFAREGLDEATAAIFVCLQAMQPAAGKADASEEIRTVIGRAYIKLVEDVWECIERGLKTLDGMPEKSNAH